ncbi:MAG: hypothetical protein QOG58_5940 [Caballeronia sp.]|jgi:hypothetical protein|nr:hypothetical protein [Caballeronia sp.]
MNCDRFLMSIMRFSWMNNSRLKLVSMAFVAGTAHADSISEVRHDRVLNQ